jgi:hypothetical protein
MRIAAPAVLLLLLVSTSAAAQARIHATVAIEMKAGCADAVGFVIEAGAIADSAKVREQVQEQTRAKYPKARNNLHADNFMKDKTSRQPCRRGDRGEFQAWLQRPRDGRRVWTRRGRGAEGRRAADEEDVSVQRWQGEGGIQQGILKACSDYSLPPLSPLSPPESLSPESLLELQPAPAPAPPLAPPANIAAEWREELPCEKWPDDPPSDHV